MSRNMTPRSASVRRRPGVVARERGRAAAAAAAAATAGDDDGGTFLTPNLPPLRGSASARRQFGYGAGTEPVPVRSPESEGVVDLGVAIQGALDRHEQQEATQRTQHLRRNQSDAMLFPSEEQQQQQQQQQQEQQQQQQRQAAEQRAMPPPLVFPRPDRDAGNSRRVGFAAPREQTSGSETDDARSFDLESDCFGDATILSSPVVQEPPGPIIPYETRILSVLPPISRSSLNTGNQGPRSQGTPGLRSGPRRPKPSARNSTDEWTQEPAPNIFANQDASNSQRRRSLVINPDSNRRTPLHQRSGNPYHGRDEIAEESTTPASYPVSLFDRDRSGSTDPSTNPFFTRSFYAPELSEMDEAMQQDIQSNARERSENGPPPQEGERGWSWKKPIKSLPFLRRNAPHIQQGQATDGAINWWQLLNPYTYFQALFWMTGGAYTFLLNFLDGLYPQSFMNGVSSIFEMLLYFIASIIGLITVISIAHAAIFGKLDGDLRVDRVGKIPDLQWSNLRWTGITHMADRVGGLIPELSWPTWSRSGSLPDLARLDNDGLSKLDEYLKQYQREFERLQKAGKLHESSLAKLEAVVPKIVHVPLQNGKPVVAQEFWHALRDLIHRDGEILTFEKKGKSYEVASEAHWKAIAAQITRDPAFAKEISKNVDSLEERVKSGAAGFWDSWVKSNDAKIAEVLGSALDQIQSAGSQKEFDKRLQRIVKEHVDDSNKKSTVVSREEFLQHLSKEFATHRAEVRAELEQIKPQLEGLVRQAAELARKDIPKSMTKTEIVALVQGMVKKAVADINLDAMARGKIQAHWSNVLKHQINYFGVGAGAIIDQKHSSTTFKPERDSTYVKRRGIKGVQPSIPRVALEPWSDEGDCWCAARSKNERSNPHGAILAVLLGWKVAPQHITIEHIVAGATTDPEARPKEIEIYADVPEKVRAAVRAYSARQFPDIYPLGANRDSWDVSSANLAERFVKIAQFVYEDVQPHDGVQVYKFSDQLLKMGVFTDHVLVRAVSNYGAADHTCFYRVRLYGKLMDSGDAST